MPLWSAADIAWNAFDPSKLDRELLHLIKAASLTEYNAAQYTHYLKNVFKDDAEFHASMSEWQLEEQQHGQMLARYAQMADPTFDFEASFRAFTDGYQLPLNATESVRGSRVGELVARCVVETGTSSFYSAISEWTEEPVLKQLTHRIAADEFRHYRTFYEGMLRYQQSEPLPLVKKLKVVIGRLRESEDDELGFAFHCANNLGQTYNRERSINAYAARAYGCYRPHHAEQVVRMTFRASGLQPRGWLADRVSKWAFKKLQGRASLAVA